MRIPICPKVGQEKSARDKGVPLQANGTFTLLGTFVDLLGDSADSAVKNAASF